LAADGTDAHCAAGVLPEHETAVYIDVGCTEGGPGNLRTPERASRPQPATRASSSSSVMVGVAVTTMPAAVRKVVAEADVLSTEARALLTEARATVVAVRIVTEMSKEAGATATLTSDKGTLASVAKAEAIDVRIVSVKLEASPVASRSTFRKCVIGGGEGDGDACELGSHASVRSRMIPSSRQTFRLQEADMFARQARTGGKRLSSGTADR
jgi:hypothetical protein